jgi:hypothetical protein
MSSASAASIEQGTRAIADRPALARRGWVVGPWFDAFCLTNIAWPVLVLAQVGEGFAGRSGIEFWQVYFITTPHRWVTLALVFLDRPRFRERRGVFLGIALVVVGVCAGVRMTTGTLTCLLAIDYVWNAWHFAAQHHGIYRIYGRLSEPERTTGLTAEKWAMRLFLLYVILRVAGVTWPQASLESALQKCDWIAILVPVWLLVHNVLRFRSGGLGRVLYLASVSSLYLSLLWAVHARRPGLVLLLATASALFHAIEYLALVGWSVQERHAREGDQLGLLGWLAPRAGIALGMFVVILGAGGWLLEQQLLQTWLLINVTVASLHYAYDGLIWRRPRPRGVTP